MIEVSTREFRNRQGYYLDRVGEGEEVLIRRRNRKSCRVVPEADDDTLMSKEELDAIIKQGLENIKNGKGKRYTMEELRVKMGL